MEERKKQAGTGRVARLKKLIIGVLVVLLILPNITGIYLVIKQASIERRVDYLAKEVADMKLQGISHLGRLDGGDRLAIAEALLDDVPDGAAPETAVADLPDSEKESGLLSDDVVWTFSGGGDVSEAPHKVYLTFDDGPSAYTDDILDILDSYGVKATFFVVGKESESDLEAYKRIVEEGHTLGMHSYSHVYSRIYSSEENFTEDLDNITSLLESATGREPQFYRFPGGSSNSVSSLDMHRFINILDDRGISYFDWNVSSGDASGELLSAEQILLNATSGIENREVSVILMHDSLDKPTTVMALPAIIEKIQKIEGTAILPITSDTEPVRHVE